VYSPEHVSQVGGKISELWESAVWKLLQSKMEDLARRDASYFVSILPKSSARTNFSCFYLQYGVRNMFNSGAFEDHGSVGKLGTVWVKIFDSHASSAETLGLSSWADYVKKQVKDGGSESPAEQSTALCLRPFCEILKEILSQCLQLKNRSNQNQRNSEKANSAASLLVTQLFVALASSERMNRLVSSLPSTSWNASHISVLLRRVFDQHTTFFGHMLENNISIPAHSFFDQRLASAEADHKVKGIFETSLYFHVSRTWAGMVFNEISAVRRANLSPASSVRSMCESLFTSCLRSQLSNVSCCAAEFSFAVLTEAFKRLQPPHRFAIAAEIASIPALIQFLQACNAMHEADTLRMTPSQQQLIRSADAFREGIFLLLKDLRHYNITEPELKCLEAPADRVSSLDMGSFLRLPRALFPEADVSIPPDVLKEMRSRFDTWKVENKRNYQIFNFLSRFFGNACIPTRVLPIAPNTPVDGKMLRELIDNHEEFVRHLSRQHNEQCEAERREGRNCRCSDFSSSGLVRDASLLHPQLRHFCDCRLFERQFYKELQSFRRKFQVSENDLRVCAHVTAAVLASIEALFIRENTTFHELMQLVSTDDDGAFSFSSRAIEKEKEKKEVTIVEAWFSDAAGAGGQGTRRVNTERVKSASKILQYRNNAGGASGAIKSLNLISSKAIKTMDDALGVGLRGHLMDKLVDDPKTFAKTLIADASKLLTEIGDVFEGMDPAHLDVIIHIEKAKAALNFLRQKDVAAEKFNLLWTNAESRAMGNEFITTVLDKLGAVRNFLQPLYATKIELDMEALAHHLAKLNAANIEELKDQLNTVAQKWPDVEWYFHSGDNTATLALLEHFQKSGRFQSMGKNCPEGPAIRFCYRMGKDAEEQYLDPLLLKFHVDNAILLQGRAQKGSEKDAKKTGRNGSANQLVC